jgi:hypothetical protein
MFLTFFGEPRWGAAGMAWAHGHDTGMAMTTTAMVTTNAA